jgi:co-chaperonin GroES (HSP10)
MISINLLMFTKKLMLRLGHNMKPLNRFVLISPFKEEEKDQPGILLPDDYKQVSKYGTGEVLATAKDCTNEFVLGDKIVYDNSLLQEIVLKEKTFYLILENYIYSIIGDHET